MSKTTIPSNREATQQPHLEIPAEIIQQFARDVDGEAKLRDYVLNWVDQHVPHAASEDALAIARETLDYARTRLNDARKLRDETYSYVVRGFDDPNHERNTFEAVFGFVAISVMIVCALTIPSFAAMLALEGQKFMLLADFPLLGLVFGAAPLAAIFASINWRSTILNDLDRLRYDRRLLRATMGAMMVWAVVMALSAFPIEFGGGESVPAGSASDDLHGWGLPPAQDAQPGFVLTAPPALIFIVTAILDLLAAPTLHRIALNHISRPSLKDVFADQERVHVESEILPAREADVSKALGIVEKITADQAAREAQRGAVSDDALARFHAFQAKLESARLLAELTAFDE